MYVYIYHTAVRDTWEFRRVQEATQKAQPIFFNSFLGISGGGRARYVGVRREQEATQKAPRRSFLQMAGQLVCVCVCVCVCVRERERERECVCVLKNKFPIYQVNEFGIEHLRSGSGVLDVAGGRGVITAKAKTKIILLLYEVTTNGTFQNYSFGWSWCYHSKDFALAHF
jgi:hypothetical protein